MKSFCEFALKHCYRECPAPRIYLYLALHKNMNKFDQFVAKANAVYGT
jgi:hypothetical protein